MRTDRFRLTIALSLFFTLTVQAAVRYVDISNLNPMSPYLDWGTAATNIQDAVAVAEAGDTVLVANGVYATGGVVVSGAMANRVALTNPITLLSVNGPQATTISGGTQTRCVYVGTNAVLSGFTLINGHAMTTGDALKERSGAGAWCEASGIVTNCLVKTNTAPDTSQGGGGGGGVYGGTLYNCVLVGNAGLLGGGARASTLWSCTLSNNIALPQYDESVGGAGAYGSALFNCLVSSNTTSAYGGGGGVCECLLSNCLVKGNTAGSRGGGTYLGTNVDCALTGNTAPYGGGAYMGNLYNCLLATNVARFAGGGADQAVLSNCTVVANLVTFAGSYGGGGTYKCTNDSCTLTGNSADTGGGAAFGSLSNCVLSGNKAGSYGGGAYQASLYNCTVAANAATNSGGGVYNAYSESSIIYFNSAPSGSNWVNSYYFHDCCTAPLPAGMGNITNNPLFVDGPNGLFQLQCGSPCIDAGWNGSAWYKHDIRGVLRPLDGNGDGVAKFDIGAYEFDPAFDLLAVISVAYTNFATQFPVAFSGRVASCAAYYWWDFGDGTRVTNQLSTRHAWSSPGQYTVRLSAYYPGLGQVLSSTTQVQVVQEVYYVDFASPDPAFPYTNWANAAREIQTAISASTTPGRLVLVGNGVHHLSGGAVFGVVSNTVVMTNPVVVQSLNGPQASTIFPAIYPSRCAWVGSNAVLSGFTLALGQVSQTGDIYKERSGGGVWCEPGGVVTNCIVYNNHANCYGGGVYGGTLYNCIVTNNSLTTTSVQNPQGGGAFGTTLYNCTVVKNVAVSSGNAGGGAAQCTLSNCLVTDNTAYVAGGGAHLSTLYNCMVFSNHVTSSSSGAGGGSCSNTLYNCLLLGNAAFMGGGAYAGELYNCTVAGNVAPIGGGVYGAAVSNSIVYLNTYPMTGGSAINSNWFSGSFSYSCTAPLPGGSGNMTNAPMFVDQPGGNFRLQTNSPCINSGANGCVGTGTDADGRPRIVNGTVDMGAYEFQGPGMNEFIGWLQRYHLPADGSADLADPDGDHFNNWQEFCFGTDPCNAMFFPRVLTPSRDDSGVTLYWRSTTNRTYFLQRSTNLSAHPAFVTIATDIPGEPFLTTFADTNATGPGPFFYRVGVQADACPGQASFSVISFAWLQQYGLPTDGSADCADADNDGMSNWQEWQCGTDPVSPESVLRLLSPVRNGLSLSVSWFGVTNRSYTVYRSTNLAANPAFLPLATNIVGQPGTTTFTDTHAAGPGPFFYRVGVQP